MHRALHFALFSIVVLVTPATAEETYPTHPDSLRNPDVPRGTVTRNEWNDSKIFPETSRTYWVYVPAQYDGSEPAAVMVVQDGHAYVSEERGYKLPIVFDNLIARGDMPVTIAIMINPGHIGENAPRENGWGKRNHRSIEYDTLSDDYARFLTEEILPEVEKDYRLTNDPEMRAICGDSSGGICAFTVAWERPDAFRKVISHIGSFTNIRGGHVYPAHIRKGDLRPIRVFLQDGSNDLDNPHGNWWLSNQQMAKALAFRDYDYKFVTGEGGHSGKHGAAIFPETLKWVWRDWKE
ncbi:alpha/beta hydrolase [Calycomorphotria hydatis]|uniref:Endo-1,4-beta-xylanase Z n=1 Tax=Calycomorphotria hydatis TaxID=2528027 RepID=A0A517T453_9PLAN|nr:alpha/beta hydrolase-fold protein [Calycomorphotria hydatis]QDT63157.1 Endo-1,4-beta-xylanase Z precursor [Calycomorphotria hydatis]